MRRRSRKPRARGRKSHMKPASLEAGFAEERGTDETKPHPHGADFRRGSGKGARRGLSAGDGSGEARPARGAARQILHCARACAILWGRGHGGIGRRIRFRILHRKACRFDPCCPHHKNRPKGRFFVWAMAQPVRGGVPSREAPPRSPVLPSVRKSSFWDSIRSLSGKKPPERAGFLYAFFHTIIIASPKE